MTLNLRALSMFVAVAALIVLTGVLQGWNSALVILNMGLVSAIMALGVNLQWGFAGLFNVGIMGFVALGGLATVLVSMPPVPDAWRAGGGGILIALLLGAATIILSIYAYARLPKGWMRGAGMAAILIGGFFLYRSVFDPAVGAVEAVNPALEGYLGGLGLPVVVAWPVGGLMAAGADWIIGETALGLRSDYRAIATLGIAEIIVAILKNEDWLARGVKLVYGIPSPAPAPRRRSGAVGLSTEGTTRRPSPGTSPGLPKKAATWPMSASRSPPFEWSPRASTGGALPSTRPLSAPPGAKPDGAHRHAVRAPALCARTRSGAGRSGSWSGVAATTTYSVSALTGVSCIKVSFTGPRAAAGAGRSSAAGSGGSACADLQGPRAAARRSPGARRRGRACTHRRCAVR